MPSIKTNLLPSIIKVLLGMWKNQLDFIPFVNVKLSTTIKLSVTGKSALHGAAQTATEATQFNLEGSIKNLPVLKMSTIRIIPLGYCIIFRIHLLKCKCSLGKRNYYIYI